jgi:hypothetical protein
MQETDDESSIINPRLGASLFVTWLSARATIVDQFRFIIEDQVMFF